MNSLQKEVAGFTDLPAEELSNISGGNATAIGYTAYYQDSNGNVWQDELQCDYSMMIGWYCLYASEKY